MANTRRNELAMYDEKTVMCDRGNHGDTERLWWSIENAAEFWTGKCRGTVRSMTGEEWECPCDCHEPDMAYSGSMERKS